MVQKFKNILLLISLANRIFQANNTFGMYHLYCRFVAWKTIHKSRIMNDGSIPAIVYKKIQWYMVNLVFMGEILADLASHKLRRKEKESCIYLGALMALFDVMIDDFKLENTALAEIITNAFLQEKTPRIKIQSPVVRIFDLYLQKLISIIPEERWPELLKHLDLIQFQVKSKHQLESKVSVESVESITIGKGGASLLICAAMILVKSEAFKKALMELGGFIQMMNDSQDMYKDTRDGITTFVHFCNSFREISGKLDVQRKIAFSELKSLPCSYKRRYRTIFCFNAMFIVIIYKLQKYAVICDHKMDFKAIAGMRKEEFRINPFSPGTVLSCFGKIVNFDYNTVDSPTLA